jgi:hypothetical protein
MGVVFCNSDMTGNKEAEADPGKYEGNMLFITELNPVYGYLIWINWSSRSPGKGMP